MKKMLTHLIRDFLNVNESEDKQDDRKTSKFLGHNWVSRIEKGVFVFVGNFLHRLWIRGNLRRTFFDTDFRMNLYFRETKPQKWPRFEFAYVCLFVLWRKLFLLIYLTHICLAIYYMLTLTLTGLIYHQFVFKLFCFFTFSFTLTREIAKSETYYEKNIRLLYFWLNKQKRLTKKRILVIVWME